MGIRAVEREPEDVCLPGTRKLESVSARLSQDRAMKVEIETSGKEDVREEGGRERMEVGARRT